MFCKDGPAWAAIGGGGTFTTFGSWRNRTGAAGELEMTVGVICSCGEIVFGEAESDSGWESGVGSRSIEFGISAGAVPVGLGLIEPGSATPVSGLFVGTGLDGLVAMAFGEGTAFELDWVGRVVEGG